jgi:hypothetical protein
MQFNLVGRLLAALAACSVSSGCAFVPDLEPESSFSYAEIVTQVQCELYLASERQRLETDKDQYNPNPFEPTLWTAQITVTPDLQIDMQANIAGNAVTSLAGAYSKWSAGGGTASATGAEINGDANASNIYNLNMAALYLSSVEIVSDSSKNKIDKEIFPTSRKLSSNTLQIKYENKDNLGYDTYNVVEDKSGTYVVADPSSLLYQHRLINPRLRKQCILSREAMQSTNGAEHLSVSTAGSYPSEVGGVLGIYDYLKRSFAVTESGTAAVNTITMTKWYKMNIAAGVTAGWFVPYGSYGPNVGGSQKLYDQIALQLKKSTPSTSTTAPTLQVVCVVRSINDQSNCTKTKAATLAIAVAAPKPATVVPGGVPPKSAIPLASKTHPVSEHDKEIMLNSGILQNLQQRLPTQ